MKNSISGKLLETLCYIALNRNYFTNISNSKKGNRISLERRQLFKHKAGAREGGAQFGKVDGGKKEKLHEAALEDAGLHLPLEEQRSLALKLQRCPS